jgi:hypothetical protein
MPCSVATGEPTHKITVGGYIDWDGPQNSILHYISSFGKEYILMHTYKKSVKRIAMFSHHSSMHNYAVYIILQHYCGDWT